MLVFSVWQLRRVVITKEIISFALIDEDSEIDFIPLSEVASVDEMWGVEDVEKINRPDRRHGSNPRIQQSSLNMLIKKSRSFVRDSSELEEVEEESTSRLFVNAFQIATIPDGYNSGRSYYLQADSSDIKQQIISQLQVLAKTAKKKAEVKSSFHKAQDRVRSLYVTGPFQGTAALLIVAVIFSASLFQKMHENTPSCAVYANELHILSTLC